MNVPQVSPSRRALLLAAPALALAGYADAAPLRAITIHKTADCACCNGWVTHLQKAGFQTTINLVDDMQPIRARYGVPAALASCHTGVIGDYVVEGHVPAGDIVRLVEEKPAGLGILVPGMPMGSPGMEGPAGSKAQPFETLLLLDRTGRTRVFASHS